MAMTFPRLDVLLLAGGCSRRMGSENKLLMPYERTSLIRHTAEQLLAAEIGKITVVTGYEAEKVTMALSGLTLSFCHNPDHETGQMSSVRSGSQMISQYSNGMMVALADMPFLTPTNYRHLVREFFDQEHPRITMPYFAGERGNPIIVPPQMLPDIINGRLNAGCRQLVKNNPDKVASVNMESSAFVTDVDTQDEYAFLTAPKYFPRACCCF